MIGPGTIEANRERPVRLGSPPRALHGEDIRAWIPHWRDGRVHRVELHLVGGDVVLLDVFALRVFKEIHESIGELCGRLIRAAART